MDTNELKQSLLEQLERASKPQLTACYIPEIERTLYVKQLTFADQIAMLNCEVAKTDPDALNYVAMSFAICDETGQPLYAPEDYVRIKALPMSISVRLLSVMDGKPPKNPADVAIDEAKKN